MVYFESIGLVVPVAPVVRRYPRLIANSDVMPKSDDRLDGDTADHVEAKKRRNAAASDSGTSRGVLRLTPDGARNRSDDARATSAGRHCLVRDDL